MRARDVLSLPADLLGLRRIFNWYSHKVATLELISIPEALFQGYTRRTMHLTPFRINSLLRKQSPSIPAIG